MQLLLKPTNMNKIDVLQSSLGNILGTNLCIRLDKIGEESHTRQIFILIFKVQLPRVRLDVILQGIEMTQSGVDVEHLV